MFLSKTLLEDNTLSLFHTNEQSYDANVIECDVQDCRLIIPEIDEFNDQYHLVSHLGHNCFDFIPYEEIIIPKTIKSIEWSFYECNKLKSIKVAKDNLNYCDVDGVLFNKDKKTLFAYPNAREEAYYIPEGTEVIGRFAFKSCNISELHIPSSVTKIEANAFYGCKRLKHIFFENRTLLNLSSLYYGDFVATKYGKQGVNPICHTTDKQISFDYLSNFLRK